jgi:hypothetical protein
VSYDTLIWLREPPDPESVAGFLMARGFLLDREPWWKDWLDHDVLSMRPADGPAFHCFFGPAPDPISPEYTAVAMFCTGYGYIREYLPLARRLARQFALEFGGRVRNPQTGRWLT